jgi:hypothetical protein
MAKCQNVKMAPDSPSNILYREAHKVIGLRGSIF